jgi:hypothetical protein
MGFHNRMAPLSDMHVRIFGYLRSLVAPARCYSSEGRSDIKTAQLPCQSDEFPNTLRYVLSQGGKQLLLPSYGPGTSVVYLYLQFTEPWGSKAIRLGQTLASDIILRNISFLTARYLKKMTEHAIVPHFKRVDSRFFPLLLKVRFQNCLTVGVETAQSIEVGIKAIANYPALICCYRRLILEGFPDRIPKGYECFPGNMLPTEDPGKPMYWKE